jgi:NitT/TauT family transport system ATP-binding protein/nitrate/nitrite transport system substrate-binding protein
MTMSTEMGQADERAGEPIRACEPIRIGMLRLTDAAPVVMAKEGGFFAAQGLDVRLSVEPSWANIADRLSYGQLDAAVILPPLAFAVTLGLRGVGTPLIVPISLSLNGNSVTLASEIADALGADGTAIEIGRRLADFLPARRARLRLAVVHTFSSHNLLLRYWLSACGINPDRDVELSVLPPADMVGAMRDGQIDGFCAGAPWGEVATRSGVGRVVVTSSDIWRNHPEKCLAVRREWAAANPALLEGLMVATLRSAQFCDDPANAEDIAAILGQDRYLAVDPAYIRTSLPAHNGGAGRSAFFADAANYPWRSHAAWFLAGMAKWGYLGQSVDQAALAQSVYRPDLYCAAAKAIGFSAPRIDSKIEGAHPVPWSLDGDPAPIAMDPDIFCDGEVFDPEQR